MSPEFPDRFLKTDIPIVISPRELQYFPLHSFVVWNPKPALEVLGGGCQSPALGLYHEIGHALSAMESISRSIEMSTIWKLADDGAPRMLLSEYNIITHFETPVARRLGEPTRLHHRGFDVPVSRPDAFSNIRRSE